MLGATRYPVRGHHAQDRRDAARPPQALGLDWRLPPLAVSFAAAAGDPPVPGRRSPTPAYGNLHGRPRCTCRLCGECDIGCNDGAKNTLDHTYLSAAAHHGADLRTRYEVRGLRRRSRAAATRCATSCTTRPTRAETAAGRLPLHRITCDRLVLGAGTFGSTYLLLRNRIAFPGLSRTLGTRFSGNGDLLVLPAGRERPRPTAASGGSRAAADR